jgi:hypothetical protein
VFDLDFVHAAAVLVVLIEAFIRRFFQAQVVFHGSNVLRAAAAGLGRLSSGFSCSMLRSTTFKPTLSRLHPIPGNLPRAFARFDQVSRQIFPRSQFGFAYVDSHPGSRSFAPLAALERRCCCISQKEQRLRFNISGTSYFDGSSSR